MSSFKIEVFLHSLFINFIQTGVMLRKYVLLDAFSNRQKFGIRYSSIMLLLISNYEELLISSLILSNLICYVVSISNICHAFSRRSCITSLSSKCDSRTSVQVELLILKVATLLHLYIFKWLTGSFQVLKFLTHLFCIRHSLSRNCDFSSS